MHNSAARFLFAGDSIHTSRYGWELKLEGAAQAARRICSRASMGTSTRSNSRIALLRSIASRLPVIAPSMLHVQHKSQPANLSSFSPSPATPPASPNSPTGPVRRKIDNRTLIRRIAEDACHRNRLQDEAFAPAIPRPLLLHAPQPRGRRHHDPPLPPEQNRR